MMQIVHDLAPGAALDFATALPSAATFASNITALANQGAKVIVDDFTYFAEPMYQDGVIEQAVSGVRAGGVDYFTDAANNREVVDGHEVGSYEAVGGYRPTTCPAIAAITSGHVDCHNFAGTGSDSTFDFGYNGGNRTLRAIMDWAEPWDGGVHTDLDLYIVDTATNTVISTATQVDNLASQQAVEYLAVSGPSSANLSLVVARRSLTAPATTPRFKIVFANNGSHPISSMERETPDIGTGDVMGPTVFGHNGGADAMSVGAAAVPSSALNDYSSYGPVTTLFGPVNGSTEAAPLSTPRVLAKPDLVATDCTTNTFFGGGDHFCGTSAAAPHAAAVAALLMQKFPSATPEAINTAMTSTGTTIAGATADMQGGGLVDALAASEPAAIPVVVGTDPASPAASTTPTVKGTAVAGSTVRIYATSDCSGSPVGTGTAATFASGIKVTVAQGSTTTFHATATGLGGSSACSTTSTTYTQKNPTPETTITKTPHKTVKTSKRKLKVSFTFVSSVAGSTFACRLDGKAFAPCTSGVTFKLKAGKHTFAVRATGGGVTDPTPATYSFKVKHKKKRHHH